MPKGVYPRKVHIGTGPVIAYTECRDCNTSLYKAIPDIRRWSGYCNTCARKQRRGVPTPASVVARMKQNRIPPTKEKHWNWQGGVTPLREAERGFFKKNIQRKVLERDNYICQICGQRGGNLQVDHIKRWSKYPELRFEMSNCRTLCMSCHYSVTYNRPMPEGLVWASRRKIIC